MWRHDLVDPGRLLDVIATEGESLSELARTTAPEAPVPSCPGFSTDGLLRHVGSVYRVVTGRLDTGEPPEHWQREPGEGQSTEEYLGAGLRELHARLVAHPPGEWASTWWPEDETYHFWRRRMAHETTVHRVDLEEAAGRERGHIGEDVALDGVDEVLRLWFGHRLFELGLSGTRESSVAVRTGDHSWFARAGPGETHAWRCTEEEAERADAQVTGPPVTVYLWLWGRLPNGAVTQDGDFDAIAQLWALLRLATR
ncbi:maleylpyruvate isomerase family mycothiol-dependent enzyme [Amycolatopsis magusensis]|uniref:Uncharacterized protein (TIGR03083 family) n=1 Tax=Amycolatopsis magusensis TaxID=882444 RepID=A0ABS4Q367_9PSEU|nr:maleylpyruvate isomerase family mycothiol-dependent enzyme [Amycolatopsis magusensis]MBP2186137.1 uncharacterized protein (TIGR03083 family) [Amycolatopsis magusensis]